MRKRLLFSFNSLNVEVCGTIEYVKRIELIRIFTMTPWYTSKFLLHFFLSNVNEANLVVQSEKFLVLYLEKSFPLHELFGFFLGISCILPNCFQYEILSQLFCLSCDWLFFLQMTVFSQCTAFSGSLSADESVQGELNKNTYDFVSFQCNFE